MFYDNYIKVCQNHGVSPTRVLKDLGISKSSYAHWKKGGEPLNETMKKIADYFGITVTELLSGEAGEMGKKNKPTDEIDCFDKRHKKREAVKPLSLHINLELYKGIESPCSIQTGKPPSTEAFPKV